MKGGGMEARGRKGSYPAPSGSSSRSPSLSREAGWARGRWHEVVRAPRRRCRPQKPPILCGNPVVPSTSPRSAPAPGGLPLDAAAPGRCPLRPAASSPAELWMMTMNSLAESLLGPPDPSKASFLDFGLGPPPPSPPLHHQQQQQQQQPGLAPPYSLQALQPPPHDGGGGGGAFPPGAASYGRPLAYAPYPGAAGSSPHHAFYHHHHHHHGASYSPYQQTSSALGHGTRLEETGKARLADLETGGGLERVGKGREASLWGSESTPGAESFSDLIRSSRLGRSHGRRSGLSAIRIKGWVAAQ
ncbi:Hypothetical predicted protein [Podarcis lilfordi]|uniref:Uncharacterized protein n=1 Tax=Podarcis lilfordi TaxID=74358 RepID=A0AA35L6A0_9SAUR|nr:Hypothetical predicted protein [Podarcis lilfordi]